MINLTSTDLISLVTSAAGAIDVHASWMSNASGVVTPDRTNNVASITTATTTTIVPAPAGGIQRNIKFLAVCNTHASVVNTVTVQFNDGTLTKRLYRATLQPGEFFHMADGIPRLFLATGADKAADNTNVAFTGGSITGVDLVTLAGSASGAGLTIGAGTNATTPGSGDVENDAVVGYYTPITSERGVLSAVQFLTQQGGTRTLASQTAAQKMFATPTNGAVTVGAARTYRFECFFALNTMSASSGSFGFAFLGTATFTYNCWVTEGVKAALATAVATQNTANLNSTANTTIVTATTNTVGWARVRGMFRINAGGTLIPAISLGVAAAAVLERDSYFECWPIGTNAVVSVGNWS